MHSLQMTSMAPAKLSNSSIESPLPLREGTKGRGIKCTPFK
jgi:hypothetical protein